MNDFIYQDILYFDVPTSKKHPRMSLENRAGQFSPFAALTGFDEKIKEVQRYTMNSIFLEEDSLDELDSIFAIIQNSKEPLYLKIHYFLKDKKKKGGMICKKEGFLKKIDFVTQEFVFDDKCRISHQDIVKIEILDGSNSNNLI